MKLTASLIPALCWSARLAAASTAHVYTYDPRSQPRAESQSSTLEPVPARLVLAQRAGVEDYHRSDLVREDVIDAINEHGLRTSLLAKEGSEKRVFILVDDTREGTPDGVLSLKSYEAFKVSPTPDDMAIRGLFSDLLAQADARSLFGITTDGTRKEIDLYNVAAKNGLKSRRGDSFKVVRSMSEFEALFAELVKENESSITALVMPYTPPDTFKHAGFMVHDQHAGSKWGTYEMPGAESPLKKRTQIKEEPLTETHAFHPVESSFTAPVAAVAANNTTPLRGILPACFTSQSACESATRKCTGHGSCVRKYQDRTASKDGKGVDCFVCACNATTSSDGKKTTKWGGPACQKKDVSVEFWLIVLFTVGLVFLIGFAVGSIWEMGQQDLPSVIGAGVSGPSARK